LKHNKFDRKFIPKKDPVSLKYLLFTKIFYSMGSVTKLLKLNDTDIIDIGELRISRTNLGRKGGFRERYVVYLPVSRNYLWKALHEKKIKIRLFIEIPREDSSDERKN